MKILIITNSYPPEIRSTSHLMYEMATELTQLGHQVTVLTSFPGYNLADGVDRSQIPEIAMEAGVKVLRAKTLPLKKVSYVRRGIAEIALPFNFWNLLKANADGFDVIWVFSPPLTLALLACWLKRKYRAKLLMNAQDIFPQNAIDLGIIHNPAAILFYERMERLAYAHSDLILVHSDSNKDFLIKEKEVSSTKVVMQYNWVDVEPFDQVKRTGLFRKRFGLNGEVIALFAGVFGPSQGLEMIIELAEHFRDTPELAFLLVGDGSEKPKLQTKVNKLGLSNIHFKPFVSRDEYPSLVKDADIGMVCLSSQVKTPVVPGKIQGYMAAGIPVLGILNRESDGHTLVSNADCGKTVVAGDTQGAIQALEEFRADIGARSAFGRAGRDYAGRYLSKSACIHNILELISIQ